MVYAAWGSVLARRDLWNVPDAPAYSAVCGGMTNAGSEMETDVVA